jgi:hypothetical protein
MDMVCAWIYNYTFWRFQLISSRTNFEPNFGRETQFKSTLLNVKKLSGVVSLFNLLNAVYIQVPISWLLYGVSK